jgi:hypothetical protein
MQTLYALVDLLASWKVNQLQLYVEHAFAYRGHEVVWRKASPLTGEEVLALDAYCRERYVELVPNQNSFGHMHRWLIHEPYRALAEAPEGIDHPFSPTREPFSLCPTDPGSLALLADLYDQLLPHFGSTQLNVGLDETWDLGRGRSAEECARRGSERVYLDFLRQIHRLVSARGHTMQFWGDIILHRPELIAELPKDAVALEWGYEADHPFERNSRLFEDAGLSFYVCPGTSSWNSIAGRTDNTLGNLSSAAVHGQASGAHGLLVTDWGDAGHMQPLPVSYLGFLGAAAMSWNAASAREREQTDWGALLDAHAFRDRAGEMGRLAYDLGNAYRLTGSRTRNSSALFYLVLWAERPLPARVTDGLSQEGLEHAIAHVDRTIAALPRAQVDRPDAALVAEEFAWAADFLRLGARIGLARLRAGASAPAGAIPAETRAGLASDLRNLIERHRRLWLQRNRPGGLDDSAARLERALAALQG